MSRLDVILDRSKEKLKELPKEVLTMSGLKMLFLEGNFLTNLPEDFFWKLPNLVWLDLRNNLLDSIPKSIANHPHLENLLLTNNNLHVLPNELGLVPKLKALQIADNPIVYPVRQIIIEGTKAIKSFLKEQHQKRLPAPQKSQEDLINPDERVLNVVEEESSSEHINTKSSSRKESTSKGISDSLRKKLSDPKMLQPTLNVKKITYPKSKRRIEVEPVKIVHSIQKTDSRISLKSTVHKLGIRHLNSQDKGLQEGWLNQLRILLNDQERILQQERNLRTLSSWRFNNKIVSTPKVFRESEKKEPPYATDPKYSKMPTREELTKQLNNFFKEKGIAVASENKNREINIDKLINDLMHQLKEMEGAHVELGSPRSEIEQAGRQIKTIMNIQKKLLQIKASNDGSI